jgi:hypothetical protein
MYDYDEEVKSVLLADPNMCPAVLARVEEYLGPGQYKRR